MHESGKPTVSGNHGEGGMSNTITYGRETKEREKEANGKSLLTREQTEGWWRAVDGGMG